MNSSKLKKTSLFVLLVVAIVGGIWYVKAHGSGGADGQSGGGWGGGKTAHGPVVPTVKAEQAISANVPVYINGLGTVTAKNTALVQSRVAGVLQKLNFVEGDVVKEGKVIAEIDPRPLEVTLEQAQGQLAADLANLTNAKLDLARYTTLQKQDSVAAQTVDTQAALVRQLEGTTKVDQANVDSAKLQLYYSRITAPISGRMGLKQVDIGNLIQTNSTTGVVIITQVQPIDVVFSIPEAQLPSVLDPIRAGKPLTVDVWDRDMSKILAHGKLLAADNEINVTTGTVNLKAEFDNNDNALFPNEFVNAQMRISTLQNAVEAPVAAVLLGKSGNFVWILGADNKVSIRLVKTGPRDGEHIVITDGLKAGETVVTDGVDQLSDGAQAKLVGTEPAAPAGKPQGATGKHHKHDTDKAAS